MKHLLFILSLFVACLSTKGQSDDLNVPQSPPPVSEDSSNEAVRYAEIMPAYPGGEIRMHLDIADSIVYPEAELKAKISGKVFIDFVIEKNGEISEVTCVRGVKDHPDFAVAAIEAIKKLKRFEPARTGNKAVRLRMTLPVTFTAKE